MPLRNLLILFNLWSNGQQNPKEMNIDLSKNNYFGEWKIWNKKSEYGLNQYFEEKKWIVTLERDEYGFGWKFNMVIKFY